MEPLAAAAYVILGTALVTAVAMGALGGALTAALGVDPAWGSLPVTGAYLATLPLLGIRAGSLVGLLPLVLTFLVASLTTRRLRTRRGLHWALAAPAGTGAGIAAGFLYLLPIRYGYRALADPGTAWLALGVVLCLMVSRRLRT